MDDPLGVRRLERIGSLNRQPDGDRASASGQASRARRAPAVVQWNPDVHMCMAGQLECEQADDGWFLSGEIRAPLVITDTRA